jgi:hypothetical protein
LVHCEAYDHEGKSVICIYFKLLGAIDDEDDETLDKENLPKDAGAEGLQEEKSFRRFIGSCCRMRVRSQDLTT